jgi:hypothetical protein
MNLPGALGLFNHADTDAVLDAGAGIESLKLGGHLRRATGGDLAEIHEWGTADELSYVLGNLHRVLLQEKTGA